MPSQSLIPTLWRGKGCRQQPIEAENTGGRQRTINASYANSGNSTERRLCALPRNYDFSFLLFSSAALRICVFHINQRMKHDAPIQDFPGRTPKALPGDEPPLG
jgi:hypothetical protein